MIITSFKELLIRTAKEIFDQQPTEVIKTKLNNFLSSIKILDSILIQDNIGLRSAEHYEINNKYVVFTAETINNETAGNSGKVLVLNHFYNQIDDINNITSKYNTIKDYIKAECNI